LSIRKLDKEAGVLVFMHLVPKLEAVLRDDSEQAHFVVGVLSNDDVRARAALGALLDVPPAFHRRREVRLVEHRWRDDPRAAMFFLANVHSAVGAQGWGRMVSVHVGGESGVGVMAAMKDEMGTWWEAIKGPAREQPDQA
jgi:hypothetical protein